MTSTSASPAASPTHPDPTTVVLIRHGESQATVDQIVGGHEGCRGLSAEGRSQVVALRDRLAATGELAEARGLYASVLPRAIETAEIISPALGGLEVVQECGVCEVHPGEADGLAWAEFETRFGSPSDEFAPMAPGGESWSTFVARVGASLNEIASKHQGDTVVIACHGGVVEAGFIVFGGLPLRKPFDMFVANTSITEWTGSPGGRWRLVRYNDAAQLGAGA